MDLDALLATGNLDILALTETFLGEDINDSEFGEGYSVFRRDRDRHGGGVMLLVREDIPAIRRQDLKTNCEVLWLKLLLIPSKLFVGVFYNPSSSNCNTIHQLQSSLAALPGSLPVVLCGDFNLPNIDWSHFNPSPVVHSRENSLLCDAISDFKW